MFNKFIYIPLLSLDVYSFCVSLRLTLNLIFFRETALIYASALTYLCAFISSPSFISSVPETSISPFLTTSPVRTKGVPLITVMLSITPSTSETISHTFSLSITLPWSMVSETVINIFVPFLFTADHAIHQNMPLFYWLISMYLCFLWGNSFATSVSLHKISSNPRYLLCNFPQNLYSIQMTKENKQPPQT